MSSTFDLAYSFTQKWEGGSKFTMDSNDPGGATKFGISFRFIRNLGIYDSDINKDGVITWQDVYSLTEEKAKALFKKYFWDSSYLQFFPNTLAVVMFDTSVNIGRSRTIKFLQKTLGPKLVQDGIIGPVTLQAVHDATKGVMCFRTSLLTSVILDQRDLYYNNLNNVTNWAKEYYEGWLNRTEDLRNFIKDMEDCDE